MPALSCPRALRGLRDFLHALVNRLEQSDSPVAGRCVQLQHLVAALRLLQTRAVNSPRVDVFRPSISSCGKLSAVEHSYQGHRDSQHFARSSRADRVQSHSRGPLILLPHQARTHRYSRSGAIGIRTVIAPINGPHSIDVPQFSSRAEVCVDISCLSSKTGNSSIIAACCGCLAVSLRPLLISRYTHCNHTPRMRRSSVLCSTPFVSASLLSCTPSSCQLRLHILASLPFCRMP